MKAGIANTLSEIILVVLATIKGVDFDVLVKLLILLVMILQTIVIDISSVDTTTFSFRNAVVTDSNKKGTTTTIYFSMQ
jgi:hypothetical protein